MRQTTLRAFAPHDRRLTDAGIMELQPLQQLRELSLQGNQAITDAGLVGLACLQSLEALDLQLCWQVHWLAPLGVCCIAGTGPQALHVGDDFPVGRQESAHCAVCLDKHQLQSVARCVAYRSWLSKQRSSVFRSLHQDSDGP